MEDLTLPCAHTAGDALWVYQGDKGGLGLLIRTQGKTTANVVLAPAHAAQLAAAADWASLEGAPAVPAPASPLATLAQALREIAEGSKQTGRWICCATDEALEGPPDVVPEGYYADNWGTANPQGAPARWVDFEKDEQSGWIYSAHQIAMNALKEAGL